MDAETAKKKGIGDALCNALSLDPSARGNAAGTLCGLPAMKQAHELSVSLRAIE